MSLREYTKLKYVADCKCGNCQAVPYAALHDAIVALELYARLVKDCRKIGPDGDKARDALDKDGGKVANAALGPAL